MLVSSSPGSPGTLEMLVIPVQQSFREGNSVLCGGGIAGWRGVGVCCQVSSGSGLDLCSCSAWRAGIGIRWMGFALNTSYFSEALLSACPGKAKLRFVLLSWSEGRCLRSGCRAENPTLHQNIVQRGEGHKIFYLFLLISYMSHFPHVPFINVLSGLSMNN